MQRNVIEIKIIDKQFIEISDYDQIVNLDGEVYYLASTNKKPIRPKVFQRIEESGKVFIDFIEDKELIKKISNKIIKG